MYRQNSRSRSKSLKKSRGVSLSDRKSNRKRKQKSSKPENSSYISSIEMQQSNPRSLNDSRVENGQKFGALNAHVDSAALSRQYLRSGRASQLNSELGQTCFEEEGDYHQGDSLESTGYIRTSSGQQQRLISQSRSPSDSKIEHGCNGGYGKTQAKQKFDELQSYPVRQKFNYDISELCQRTNPALARG